MGVFLAMILCRFIFFDGVGGNFKDVGIKLKKVCMEKIELWVGGSLDWYTIIK